MSDEDRCERCDFDDALGRFGHDPKQNCYVCKDALCAHAGYSVVPQPGGEKYVCEKDECNNDDRISGWDRIHHKPIQ